MRRWLIALALLLGGLTIGFVACRSVRHQLVESFSNEYEPPIAANFTPVFDGADAARDRVPIVLRKVATGFIQPTDVALVPGQPDLMLVLEKYGKLKWVDLAENPRSGVVLERKVIYVSEQGLLGIAFHPRFVENGLFYLNYTVEAGGKEITRIDEWKLSPGTSFRKARPKQTRVLLEVEQPYQNHNGGGLAFGPGGMLYVGLGDGGWMNDPHEHGQNKKSLLGAMLRIDVDTRAPGKAYGIPADNPFAGDPEFAPEVYAYGLRNPWRYSFAPDGRLIGGDVGQDLYEEITWIPKGGNLGWNIREAKHCFEAETCDTTGLIDPVHEYGRDEGGSVTGGFVQLSDAPSALKGRYIFGDFLSGRMWALHLESGEVAALGKWPILISTFARDERGRIYVADYPRGDIYRIDPVPESDS